MVSSPGAKRRCLHHPVFECDLTPGNFLIESPVFVDLVNVLISERVPVIGESAQTNTQNRILSQPIKPRRRGGCIAILR